ncbi:hypothetical protein J7K44_02995 [bacterium]|nr:hypothetical protein [bacterium]
MKVFDFHFNPKAKKDVIFDSFCYEPENIYEKKLGNLYIVGEVVNAFPQNVKLLDTLSLIIKKEFYSNPQRSSEKALNESLKKVNQFLQELTKKGNVDWLGNLNLAILNINSTKLGKDFLLNFTKIGNLKILLLRREEIMDISQNLEFQDVSSSPSRIFGNIVTGKLTEGDKILIFTDEIFNFFLRENLIQELANLPEFNQKNLKEVLKPKEKELETLCGLSLFLELKSEAPLIKAPPHPFIFKTPSLKISLASILFGFIKKELKVLIKKVFGYPSEKIKGISNQLIQTFSKKKPQFKISPKIIETNKERKSVFSKKNLILILLLLLFLISNFFIFKNERERPYREAEMILGETRAKIILAKNALISKEENRANLLFQEAWQKILPLTKTGAPLREEALALKETIEKNLANLNKLEKIEKPLLIFEFKKKETELIPHQVLEAGKKLYFFNPFSSNIYEFDPEKRKGRILKTDSNLKLATSYLNSVLFFAEPNQLFYLKDKNFQKTYIEPPLTNFSFNNLASFQSNIYFLDVKSGEIVKYSSLWQKIGKLWLLPKTKKAIGAKSMAIDGSIWILNKEGKIDRYFAGSYKETLSLNLFPYLEKPTKIWTSLNHPYLYLLEPAKKRIVILNKHGEIVKQYQSEKFNNLLDFAVSQDVKTIYLLNGSKVYQINL